MITFGSLIHGSFGCRYKWVKWVRFAVFKRLKVATILFDARMHHHLDYALIHGRSCAYTHMLNEEKINKRNSSSVWSAASTTSSPLPVPLKDQDKKIRCDSLIHQWVICSVCF